jgi:hypothetical protein
MTLSNGIVLGILLAGLLFSIGRKKLTVPAALTGAVLGWVIYAGGGFTGLAMMTAFFILGTAATSWKKDRKSDVREPAAHQPTRTIGQVLANAGVAGLAGLLNLQPGGHEVLLWIVIAGCFASATADTLSSELGMVYGRRFFNIMTGRTDLPDHYRVRYIRQLGRFGPGRLIRTKTPSFQQYGQFFEHPGRRPPCRTIGDHVNYPPKPTINKGFMIFFTALR